MGEAKLVFLSFETKYLTPKIGLYIKSKLLKSYIKYIKFKTLNKDKMPKKYENKCNFEKYLQSLRCLFFTEGGSIQFSKN